MKLLRLLEYDGSPEFIARSLKSRGVKGQHTLPDGCIREFILGDLDDLMLEAITKWETPKENTDE